MTFVYLFYFVRNNYNCFLISWNKKYSIYIIKIITVNARFQQLLDYKGVKAIIYDTESKRSEFEFNN